MKKILVTPRSLTRDGHPALENLREAGFEIVYSTPGKQPSEEELIELLPGCSGYLAGVERISAKVLESAKELKVISRNGSGVDNIDLDAASRLGIRICKAEGANARGVAELTIALILALVRSIPFHDSKMKAGIWERKKGFELEGKTLGLVGCGQIGKLVTLLGLGFGTNVLAYRRHPDLSFKPSEKFAYADMDNLLRESDIISLHRPASPDGKPVITSDLIERMKTGALLINTSRASLVDDEAVLKALDNGKLAGYGVDVYNEEPPEDWKLVKHPKVISTPHIGGYTRESVDRATVEAVENLIKYLK